MRQTVAVGIIKSVDKTEKSGGKGKNFYAYPPGFSQIVRFSDEVCGEGGQKEVIDVESSCITFPFLSSSFCSVLLPVSLPRICIHDNEQCCDYLSLHVL